jgi:hypothetical protein
MEHFRLFIDEITPVETKNGVFYYSFWVRLILEDTCTIAISGWKYFPDKGNVLSPSIGKGKGKFFHSTKTNLEMHNMIVTKARSMFNFVETSVAVGASKLEEEEK